MKRILLIIVVLAAWKHWDRLEPMLPGKAQQVAGQGEVILYATSWCGYCAKTREFLGERGIPYTNGTSKNPPKPAAPTMLWAVVVYRCSRSTAR